MPGFYRICRKQSSAVYLWHSVFMSSQYLTCSRQYSIWLGLVACIERLPSNFRLVAVKFSVIFTLTIFNVIWLSQPSLVSLQKLIHCRCIDDDYFLKVLWKSMKWFMWYFDKIHKTHNDIKPLWHANVTRYEQKYLTFLKQKLSGKFWVCAALESEKDCSDLYLLQVRYWLLTAKQYFL